MSSNMVKVKILHVGINKTNQIDQLAQFVDEVPNLGYGFKRYITQIGEVAILDFNKNGISDVMQEISFYFKNYNSNNNSLLSIDIDDVWRFFADKSSSGLIWHLDSYRYSITTKEEIKKLNASIVSEIILQVEEQAITFNCWKSLTNEEKEKMIILFTQSPIKSTEPILNHFSQLILK
jgi:hypothetical protein